MTVLQQMFVTPDGRQFATKTEAQDYLRRPKILEALEKLTEGNSELSAFIIDSEDAIRDAFDTGTIRRVTKAEQKKLEKAVEALKALENAPKDLAFLVDNATAVLESFRWPKVQRMKPEEKTLAAKNTLLALTDGNDDLCNWIIANQEAVLAAYEAGKEKRQVSEKATTALAAYREAQAKLKAEKAAAGEAKADGGQEPAEEAGEEEAAE